VGRPALATALTAAALTGVATLVGAARRDRRVAERRLDSRPRASAPSRFGPLEYVDTGSGDPPLLVSHGIFHGFDGGLVSVADLIDDRRVIVPSRFGYLGTPLPPAASGADQADAFVDLLDHLGLARVDVLAISAGTGPAVQLALRHPDRVGHLVISSGNFPGSTTAQAPPGWAARLYSDGAMWALKTFARPMFAGLMGVPRGFPKDDDQALVVERMLDSIFPIGPRAAGAVHDAYRSNPEIGTYPLEDLAVPALIIHARDDPLASHAAAVAAADRIPGSTLVTLDSGGHLQLGQSERVRAEFDAFLAGHDAPSGG
jgi:pimeloyl-ACP methyl ester carboxylesterase